MNVLIVFDHPRRNSLSGAVLGQFVEGLEEAGHTTEIADLHSEKFDPRMPLTDEPDLMAAYTIDTSHTPAYGLGYICEQAQPKVCVGSHYGYDDVFNNETVAEVRYHYQGAFAFGAPDLVVFNIHSDGKVWWREGVVAGSSQTPRPVYEDDTITFPAPRHQVYDVINETIEGNELDPELWYPEGKKPELVREWPLTEDITIPKASGSGWTAVSH